MYCDLVFSQENEKFIQWLEMLEQTCCKRIYENRAKWFENDLEESEIENYLTSPYKIYKSGKLYVLRAIVPTLMEACDLKIYDEGEREVEYTDLKENDEVIVIAEFKGIKCAVRSFQFDIELKQMLLLSPKKLFNRCLISVHGGASTAAPQAPPNVENRTSKIEGAYITATTETSSTKTEEHSVTQNVGENKQKGVRPDLEENSGEDLSPHLDVAKQTIQDMVANGGDVSSSVEIGRLQKTAKGGNVGEIEEVDFNLEDLENSPPIHLKERNDVYYKMYREAKKKAKEAKMLALSNYLEAKRIKTTYLLDSEDSDDSDLEETFAHQNI